MVVSCCVYCQRGVVDGVGIYVTFIPACDGGDDSLQNVDNDNDIMVNDCYG